MAFKSARQWQLLAVLAFGAPLSAIAFVQYRWLQELRTRSEMLASQQHREAALQAVSLLQQEIRGARLRALPPVGHADLAELRLEPLGAVFERGAREFPYVDRFFVWARPQSPADTLFYFPEERGFRRDSDQMRRLPPELWEPQGMERWVEMPCLANGPPCRIVIHRILDEEDLSLVGVAGFIVDLEEFAEDFLPVFFKEHLRPAINRLLEVEEVSVGFFDETGECVLGFAGDSVSPGASSVEFPISFSLNREGVARIHERPGWRLSVGEAGGDRVQEIVRRGALGNLAIVGIGIVVLGFGSVLIARSQAREAKLSDLQSRFISGISHELKKPLSMIRLYSEMLELGRVPGKSERQIFYRTLRQQAQIMGHMLEDVLDFARLEAEQQPVHEELCSLKEVLEEAVEMHDVHMTTDPSVVLSLDEELPTIRCHRSSLVRVVRNLLDNASRHSEASEPIRMTAYKQNGMVAVEVSEQGMVVVGRDERQVLFHRFSRRQAPPGMSGVGLGLSIAQSVVKLQGGRIEVESQAGRRRRFKLLLPVP